MMLRGPSIESSGELLVHAEINDSAEEDEERYGDPEFRLEDEVHGSAFPHGLYGLLNLGLCRGHADQLAHDVGGDGGLLGDDEFFGHRMFGSARASAIKVDLRPAASRSMISANQSAKQGDTAMRRDKVQGNSDLIARCETNA